jgi:DNA-binding MarR family transcriptional regulator
MAITSGTQIGQQTQQKNAPDMETRLGGESGGEQVQSLRLWLRLLSCTTLIETEIRARLRSEFDTTLPRFDLMAQLERHPEGLRMGELSKRMMVTGANITGITDQLEQENLVQRIPDSTDRRVFSVQLTAHGRAIFSAMAAQHESWVAELFGGLSGEQKSQLSGLLSALKQSGQQSKADFKADYKADFITDPKATPTPEAKRQGTPTLTPIRSLL